MQKLGRRGLHDHVVREIGERIIRGELEPGQPLPKEVVLVKTLGVSRTALREAFRVLAAKGLLEATPKVGTIVRPPANWNYLDPDVFAWRLDSEQVGQAVAELNQLRHNIEPLAASLAATHATRQDIASLKSAYADMELAGDNGAAFLDPDVRFHRGIIAATGNALFATLGIIIGAALEVFFRLEIGHPEFYISALTLHKAVLDAICARDPKAARLAMRRLIEDAEHDAQRIRNWKLRTARTARLRSGVGRTARRQP